MESLPNRSRPAHCLPHERHNEPIIVFVTCCIQPRVRALDNPRAHDAFLQAVGDADHWMVGRYVLMPDHFHLFGSPMAPEYGDVKAWARYLKERFTKRFGSHPAWEWQPDCWDTQMRSAQQYQDKWHYVWQNSARSNLAKSANEWPYQGELNQLGW